MLNSAMCIGSAGMPSRSSAASVNVRSTCGLML
jgi:hypothetical protein